MSKFQNKLIFTTMKIIDLRSDTVTKPSEAMRQAMLTAEVGDDVFGDDPTVNELEKYVANMFGRESSIFVPSGTMANQICLKVNTEPGWELLCERECHLVNYEAAGPAVHAGLLVNLLTTDSGILTADLVRNNIRPRNIHSPLTKIVAIENSHNRHGGTIVPQNDIVELANLCKEYELIFHLDGARIWNVHAATDISLKELTAPFDSISVCLSKGLGAPVGSMIIGSSKFIEKCRRERKLFGGGMRQAGIIAAAGLFAVKNNIERLAEDHSNARILAESLNALETFEIDLDKVQTNIVAIYIKSGTGAGEVIEKMISIGIKAVAYSETKIRFVTHLDVSEDDCKEAMERISKAFS